MVAESSEIIKYFENVSKKKNRLIQKLVKITHKLN